MWQSSIRRACAALLLLAVTLALTPVRAAADGHGINVDGRVISAATDLVSGQIAVAVRPFVEAMGGQLVWNAADRQILIRHNGSQVALWVGTRTAYQDGELLYAPFDVYIRNGSSMVPAWWLATRMGAKVSFNGSTLFVQTDAGGSKTQGEHFLMQDHYYFPYPAGVRYERYYDTMGDPRYYQGRSFYHEGTDILAARGTPIVAVAAGTVVRFGWNTLGGYRVTIELDDYPGWRFYYAHLDQYGPNLRLGAHVKAGQLLGYTGSTGEGPERTEGKFVNHLHFGIYAPDGSAVNPYPMLKYWEQNKIRL